MPPRKRSSTATDGNGPPKRARPGSSDNPSSNDSTAPPSASNSAASPPVVTAPPPRPERFSAVSATANAWQIWREFIARDPDYAYSFMCLCKLPHEQDDYDSEDEEGDDGGEDEAEESEGEERPGEGKRPRCSRGKACLCHRLVVNRPNHKISVSCAGYRLLAYQMTLASLRCPDNFGMYTFNDHAAFGLVEVVENVFADFELFKDSWRDRWALCEAVVMFLLGDVSAEMFMLPDPDKLQQMLKLLGCMFLTMLQHLEREDVLRDAGPVANLGLVMGLYMQLFERVHSDFGLLEEGTHDDEVIGGSVMLNGSIHSYADRYLIEIRGADMLEDLIKELAEIDDFDIPKEDEPWDWEGELERYESMGEGELGGDHWDITTWQPKERKDAAFNKKDPLSRTMINHIKSGALMQLA